MLLQGALVTVGAVAILSGIFLATRGLRNASTWLLAGHLVAFGGFPLLLVFLPGFFVSTSAFTVLYLLSTACIFAFALVYPALKLTQIQKWLVAWAFTPFVSYLAVFLTAPDLIGPTAIIVGTFFVQLAWLVPTVIFSRRWFRASPGEYRTQTLWALGPFVFWAIHDSLGTLAFHVILGGSLSDTFGRIDLMMAATTLASVMVIGAIALVKAIRRTDVDAWRFAALIAVGALASIPQTRAGINANAIHLLVDAISLLLLWYGVARYRVLDVDLRIRAGVRNGTIASAFVLIYVAASQSVAFLVAPRIGTITGVAAAGVLALGIVPLQRAATRFTDKILPDSTTAGRALHERRTAMYRASLEQVLTKDGTIPAEELRFLRDLRRQIGLSENDHMAIELKVRTHRGLPGGIIADRYRLQRDLGKGGMGRVYLAQDEKDGRAVALKRITGREARAIEEARLASAVTHEGIVGVHAVETVGEDTYLVMEYCPGGSLEDARIAGIRLSELETRVAMARVLAALSLLHARGIIHGDIKPANILLDAQGGAKLADFSIARASVSGQTIGFQEAVPAGGTLEYMAPEQTRGIPATRSSDLYGVAATTYAILALRPPFDLVGSDDYEARQRIGEELPDLPLPNVSPQLNSVLARGLAKKAQDRYTSADEMRVALSPSP